MTLEVIGAGHGRTGTMSLKAALERLGYGPCYHMTEVFAHPEHVPLWERATRGEEVDWEEVFRGYRAAVDYPPAAFYERLMERYPEAKVILTVRDPERWYRSARNTIYNIRGFVASPLIRFAAHLVPRLRTIRAVGAMASELVWEREFEGRFEDREYATGLFARRNERVREVVPPEKLLVFDVREGWGPLCGFLDAPVPDEPFPHLNDGEEFRGRIRNMRRISAAVVAVPLVVLVLLLARRSLRRP